MKFLIWSGCIIGASMLQVLFGYAGIGGAIPAILIYGGMFWSAKALCNKWDDYRYKKDREKFQKEYKEPTPPPGYVPVVKETDETPEVVEQTEPPKIKFCRKCGFELLEGSAFCSKCGTPIAKE